MRRVDICVPAGKVRHSYFHHGPRPADAVDFFHDCNHVIDVLDHIVGVDFAEVIAWERPRPHVEVVRNVGTGSGGDVEINCAGKMLVAATQVQRVPLQ